MDFDHMSESQMVEAFQGPLSKCSMAKRMALQELSDSGPGAFVPMFSRISLAPRNFSGYQRFCVSVKTEHDGLKKDGC